jgi:nitrate/TMAO reductase-like tetraheme cytochrome c subunit
MREREREREREKDVRDCKNCEAISFMKLSLSNLVIKANKGTSVFAVIAD